MSIPLKDAFKRRIEHIQMRARRNKMHAAKGFYTKQKMKKSLEWSPSFSKYTSMCVLSYEHKHVVFKAVS